jgi:uncharacterized protein (DUF885 family)
MQSAAKIKDKIPPPPTFRRAQTIRGPQVTSKTPQFVRTKARYGVSLAIGLAFIATGSLGLPLALAAETATVSATPSAALSQLISDYDRYLLEQNPILAARMGDMAAARIWPDSSPAAEQARFEAAKTFKARVEAISLEGLSGDELANRAFLITAIKDDMALHAFDAERTPFSADSGFHQTPDYVARGTIIRTEADAAAWLARLEALPAFYEMNIANARRGIATGFTQPAIVLEAALNAARAQADAKPGESSLLQPFAKLPASFSAERQATLQAAALEIVTKKIKPAERAYVTFLDKDYRPHVRAQPGVRFVPQGPDYYAYLVKSYTTTEMTPDQVHELGLSEVARITAEMEAVKAQAKFKGSLPEFIAHLRKDKQFYVTTRLALVEKVSTIAKRIDDQLPKFFGT